MSTMITIALLLATGTFYTGRGSITEDELTFGYGVGLLAGGFVVVIQMLSEWGSTFG